MLNLLLNESWGFREPLANCNNSPVVCQYISVTIKNKKFKNLLFFEGKSLKCAQFLQEITCYDFDPSKGIPERLLDIALRFKLSLQTVDTMKACCHLRTNKAGGLFGFSGPSGLEPFIPIIPSFYRLGYITLLAVRPL